MDQLRVYCWVGCDVNPERNEGAVDGDLQSRQDGRIREKKFPEVAENT